MSNLPDSFQITHALPGLHRVRRAKADRVFEYWYAWRGGPQVLAARASNPRTLARLVARQTPSAIDAYKRHIKTVGQRPVDHLTLFGLIT